MYIRNVYLFFSIGAQLRLNSQEWRFAAATFTSHNRHCEKDGNLALPKTTTRGRKPRMSLTCLMPWHSCQVSKYLKVRKLYHPWLIIFLLSIIYYLLRTIYSIYSTYWGISWYIFLTITNFNRLTQFSDPIVFYFYLQHLLIAFIDTMWYVRI